VEMVARAALARRFSLAESPKGGFHGSWSNAGTFLTASSARGFLGSP
jgi:hypothetical protein